MKYLSYLVWAFIAFLSVLFLNEYLVNHTYYYDMLSNSTNWYIVLFGILAILVPLFYIFTEGKKSWKGIFWSIFFWFALFSLVIWINKWWYISLWYLVEMVNYIILFSYFFVILFGSFSLWDLILKNIKFKESIYNFSIKFAFGFALLSILLYFIVAFWLINIYVSYFLFFALALLLIYKFSSLKTIWEELLNDLVWFNDKISKLWYIKYIFYFVWAIVFFYIFIWLNYSFIAYPTAWDASHAYIYYPKVFVDYNGYPWNTDFRPWYILWSAVLAWVWKLWTWTWFSIDTWMIVFNFLSWVLALFFGFMLINAIVKILDNKKDKKHYLLLSLWYILILTWLTSWMGAFLVFVDNKTDLAVLMYVILWLFLLIYSLGRGQESSLEEVRRDLKIDNTLQENNEEITNWSKEEQINSQFSILNSQLFLALSWFFFAIANLIKPTATFDFFESVVAFTILNTWIFLAIWIIVFVLWVLSYLKYRGFDQAINTKYAIPFIWTWLWISLAWFIDAILRNSKKIVSLFIFVWVFLWTLILTKWTFGLLQSHYDNLDKDPKKVVQAIIMWNKFPILKKDKLTWSLYTWLKEPIGSAYNEDNNRYKWYGSHNFWEVWWSFIVPSKFKATYCISFTWASCWNFDKDIYEKIVNDYAFKILQNKDEKLFDLWLENTISSYGIEKIAQQYGISTNWKSKQQLMEILKPKIAQNISKQIFNDIKNKLNNRVFDINKYPQIVINKTNEEILKKLQNNPVYYTDVSIPYDYLIPFNVSFNRSLQNETSYYTDIGIVWLLLAILLIFALIYSIVLLFKALTNKDQELFDYSKFLLAFSLATLVGWGIWYFVAAGIVWYNIGWIIWLIIVTIIFSAKLKDKSVLIYVLLVVSILSIALNLFRIASQWGQWPYNWYRSSVWESVNYYMTNKWLESKKEAKIPYTRQDLFNLQFPQYNKIIEWFNNREKWEKGIIWWTYAKYFIKNQDNIKDDQFLMYLWKLGSDNNIEKFYQRLKDQNITDIVLDPNIASVVMWTWNIELWYRYFGKLDKNWNFVEEWVLPHLVDLAQDNKLSYVSSNNLWIKYALIYSDEELSKILGISDLDKIRKIRYELIALRFLQRNIGFDYPVLSKQMQNEWLEAYQKILTYRLTEALKWNLEGISSDLIDINSINTKDTIKTKKDLYQKIADFNELSDDDKKLVLILQNTLWPISWNPQSISKIANNLLSQWIQSRAQVFYVKIK